MGGQATAPFLSHRIELGGGNDRVDETGRSGLLCADDVGDERELRTKRRRVRNTPFSEE
jgi:hypothetical protein